MSRRPAISIRASWGHGETIAKMSKVLDQRQKYLNETAFQSIHAVAVDTLKSIRGMTKVAKPSKLVVSLQPLNDLEFSYSRKGGYPKMCLRKMGKRIDNASTSTKIVFCGLHGVKNLKSVKVWGFTDEYDGTKGHVRDTYAIAAVSQAKARDCARNIQARRLLRFAGLAKRAISALMVKTNTKGPADAVSARVYAKANEVTESRNLIRANKDGGVYALVMNDELRYATRAVKGGAPAVNLALQKAANKSVGLIRKKCGNLLAPGELKTPFPEIKKKRAA